MRTCGDVNRALHGTGHELPDLGDVSYTVAARRATRVGHDGDDIEDTGVSGSFHHEVTLRDLTDRNADLLAYAAGLLSSESPTDLRFSVDDEGIVVTTVGLDRVTVEVDGVPFGSRPVVDGIAILPIIDEPDQHEVELVGYGATRVHQRRRVRIPTSPKSVDSEPD